MENLDRKTNAGQGLGIAGFVLGGIALVICWIPCVGVWAVWPGGVGIILSAIAFAQASRGNGRKGFMIAGLIVSIISTTIAVWQYFALQRATREFRESFEDIGIEWKEALDEMEEDGSLDKAFDELDDVMDSLSVNLTNLESDLNEANWDSLISSEDYDLLIDEYEQLVNEYIKFVKKANDGDIGAITSYMKVNSRIMIFTMKLATVMPKMSSEQIDRFNNIDAEYKIYFQE